MLGKVGFSIKNINKENGDDWNIPYPLILIPASLEPWP